MKKQDGVVIFGTTPIHYEIRRSGQRDTVAISVNPDASIIVIAPKGLRRSRIEEVVRSKAAWILRQQDLVGRHHQAYPKEFVSGEAVYYLGRQYRLKILMKDEANTDLGVVCTRGEFRITVRTSSTTEERSTQVRRAMIGWMKHRASEKLPGIVRLYASRLGVSVSCLQVRDLRKRWGSGGPSGKLSFNWRIIMAPRRLVEYVVAHELCHIRHNDHSHDFWNLLGRVMPDYDRRRSELERIGPKLDLQQAIPT